MTISRKNNLGTIIIKWLVKKKKTREKKKEGKKIYVPFFGDRTLHILSIRNEKRVKSEKERRPK